MMLEKIIGFISNLTLGKMLDATMVFAVINYSLGVLAGNHGESAIASLLMAILLTLNAIFKAVAKGKDIQ